MSHQSERSSAVDAALLATPTGAGNTSAEPVDVSLLELISVPERFKDRWVRLMGFVVIEFEGNAIYLHAEDFEHSLTRNALWIDVRDAQLAQQGGPGYAIVEGQFQPNVRGHLELFSGAITHVQRLVPWPGRIEQKAAPK
jgi:hypothetical protein